MSSPPPDENPAAAVEPADSVSTLGGPAVSSGTLPARFLQLVVAGAALVSLAILLVTSDFSIVLFLLFTALIAMPVAYIWSLVAEGRRQALDKLVTLGIATGFGLAVLPLISVLYEVIKRGTADFNGNFFTESARGVIGAGGGAQHAILGTLVITGVATVISVPIGIMAAVYLNEYGTGRLRRALTFFVDVMTGIPSIVAGLFAYALFAAFLGPGIRLGIIGSVALTVLMIPIVIRSAEEILKIVEGGDPDRPAHGAGRPRHRRDAGDRAGDRRDGAAARDDGGDRLGQHQPAQWPDAEPRRLRIQRVQEPRCGRAGLLRQGVVRGPRPDPDRDDPQPGRTLGLP
jgi:phosphate transport system permease protein